MIEIPIPPSDLAVEESSPDILKTRGLWDRIEAWKAR
jgi:hypothetical protein